MRRPPQRDERIPARLWELPRRVERANLAGPKYNQHELARKSQVSQSVISKLGSWSNLYGIRLDTIYRLAAALKVSVCWLLGETTTEMRRAPPRSTSTATPAAKTERPTHRRLRVGKGPSRRTG